MLSLPGYVGIDEERCVSRGCCWLPVERPTNRPHIDLPWCFHSNTGRSSYDMVDTKPTGGHIPWYHAIARVYCNLGCWTLGA